MVRAIAAPSHAASAESGESRGAPVDADDLVTESIHSTIGDLGGAMTRHCLSGRLGLRTPPPRQRPMTGHRTRDTQRDSQRRHLPLHERTASQLPTRPLQYRQRAPSPGRGVLANCVGHLPNEVSCIDVLPAVTLLRAAEPERGGNVRVLRGVENAWKSYTPRFR